MRLATTNGHWPFDAEQWHAWLGAPGCDGYFACDAGGDVGHFALRVRDWGLHLSWLLVRARARGGRGPAILDLACQAARADEAKILTLNVMRANLRAHALYLRYGFMPVSETSDKIMMRLNLEPASR